MISPIKKIYEGVPSKTMLTILPRARPSINRTFDKVAATQNLDLIIPTVQNIDIAIYKPIIALKIFARSGVHNSNFKISLKIPFGINPYTIATGTIMQIDMSKWRFFVFKSFPLFKLFYIPYGLLLICQETQELFLLMKLFYW